MVKLRRNKGEPAGAGAVPPPPDLDPAELDHMFATPAWLRDAGTLAWLLVGVGVLLFGLIWFLGQISSIVGPVVAAAIVAAVTAPMVTSLHRHMPRAAAAGIVLLGLLLTGAVVALLVVGGIIDNSAQISAALNKGADTIRGWATDLGVGSSGADSATSDVTSAVPSIGATLLKGVAGGIEGLTSVAFFLSFFFFSTFFLLKDGRVFRRFIDRHLGIPQAVATVITGDGPLAGIPLP